jgi:hypothetical protein
VIQMLTDAEKREKLSPKMIEAVEALESGGNAFLFWNRWYVPGFYHIQPRTMDALIMRGIVQTYKSKYDGYDCDGARLVKEV